MGNIKASLNGVFRKIRQDDRRREKLRKIFLPQENRHVTDIKPRGEKLVVYVDSSAVLYELKLKKNDILKKLKETKLVFKDLVFKIGA